MATRGPEFFVFEGSSVQDRKKVFEGPCLALGPHTLELVKLICDEALFVDQRTHFSDQW